MTYVLRRGSPGLPLSEVDERPSALCMCSYYPLYPPPLGACLDTSLGQALEMPCTPDIMLFPSDLAPFAKLVQCGASLDQAASSAGDPNTVCINPGRLVKDKSGATYAWLQASKACLCYARRRLHISAPLHVPCDGPAAGCIESDVTWVAVRWGSRA